MIDREPLAYATLAEIEEFAAKVLPDFAHGYYASGARDERTLRANVAAWDRWWLLPRVLVDITGVSLATRILGVPARLPILIAPMALQKMAHPDGELAVARAAAAAGAVMVLSTSSSTPVEEVAAVPGLDFLFQLYPFEDAGETEALIDRALAAGAKGIVLTVDVAIAREAKRRPRGGLVRPDWAQWPLHPREPEIIRVLDWAYVERLRARLPVPLVLKGIVHPADAVRAADAGAAAVVVSNHGGRMLDGTVATAEILPEVVEALGGRIDAWVDGGVRRGSDTLRALALGARAVLVGRPVLWGLAVAGEAGVRRTLSVLETELREDVARAGVTDVTDVPRDLVRLSRIGVG